MGIREKLNENPAITTGATIGIIVIALIFIGVQLFSSSNTGQIQTEAYYTTDDSSPEKALGAMFADSIDKLPPFQKDGKDAYRVYVFTCDGGKTKFISHLQRYTKEAQTKIAAAMADKSKPMDPGVMEMTQMTGIEVKKPGPGPWVKQADYEKARLVTEVKCPDGTLNNIESVLP